MNNVLTQTEILEQFGNLPLNFRSFSNSTFIFSGISESGVCVILYVPLESLKFVDINSLTTIDSYLENIGREEPVCLMVISHDFEILFENSFF